MARFSRRDNRTGPLLMNALDAVVVGFTLLIDIARGQPIASVAAALLIAAAVHRLWLPPVAGAASPTPSPRPSTTTTESWRFVGPRPQSPRHRARA